MLTIQAHRALIDQLRGPQCVRDFRAGGDQHMHVGARDHRDPRRRQRLNAVIHLRENRDVQIARVARH